MNMEIVGEQELTIEEARAMGILPSPIATHVFFNGPAGSGKDHMAQLLVSRGQDAYHMKFSGILKRTVAHGLGMSFDVLETMKEEKLFGKHGDKSYRDLQIELYKYLEDTFDDRILGRQVLGEIEGIMEDKPRMGYAFFYSDAGRGPEVDEVAKAVGRDKCLIIRLHREGCEFNDYRSYVEVQGVTTWDFTNEGTKASAEELVQRVVKWTQRAALTQQGISGANADRALELHDKINELQSEFQKLKQDM